MATFVAELPDWKSVEDELRRRNADAATVATVRQQYWDDYSATEEAKALPPIHLEAQRSRFLGVPITPVKPKLNLMERAAEADPTGLLRLNDIGAGSPQTASAQAAGPAPIINPDGSLTIPTPGPTPSFAPDAEHAAILKSAERFAPGLAAAAGARLAEIIGNQAQFAADRNPSIAELARRVAPQLSSTPTGPALAPDEGPAAVGRAVATALRNLAQPPETETPGAFPTARNEVKRTYGNSIADAILKTADSLGTGAADVGTFVAGSAAGIPAPVSMAAMNAADANAETGPAAVPGAALHGALTGLMFEGLGVRGAGGKELIPGGVVKDFTVGTVMAMAGGASVPEAITQGVIFAGAPRLVGAGLKPVYDMANGRAGRDAQGKVFRAMGVPESEIAQTVRDYNDAMKEQFAATANNAQTSNENALRTALEQALQRNGHSKDRAAGITAEALGRVVTRQNPTASAEYLGEMFKAAPEKDEPAPSAPPAEAAPALPTGEQPAVPPREAPAAPPAPPQAAQPAEPAIPAPPEPPPPASAPATPTAEAPRAPADIQADLAAATASPLMREESPAGEAHRDHVRELQHELEFALAQQRPPAAAQEPPAAPAAPSGGHDASSQQGAVPIHGGGSQRVNRAAAGDVQGEGGGVRQGTVPEGPAGARPIAPTQEAAPPVGGEAGGDVQGVAPAPVSPAGESAASGERRALGANRPDYAALRERWDSMTDAEKAAARENLIAANERASTELRTHPMTGLPNRRAFEEDALHSPTGGPVHIGAVDLDSMKWINDNFGHDKGDEFIRTASDTFSQAIHFSGLDVKVYALGGEGGDEFALTGPSERAIIEVLNQARDRKPTITHVAEDGTRTVAPVGWSYGIVKAGAEESAADALKRADAKLAEDKLRREAGGLRARRGDTPPGVARIPAAGGDAGVLERPRPEAAVAPPPVVVEPDTRLHTGLTVKQFLRKVRAAYTPERVEQLRQFAEANTPEGGQKPYIKYLAIEKAFEKAHVRKSRITPKQHEAMTEKLHELTGGRNLWELSPQEYRDVRWGMLTPEERDATTREESDADADYNYRVIIARAKGRGEVPNDYQPPADPEVPAPAGERFGHGGATDLFGQEPGQSSLFGAEDAQFEPIAQDTAQTAGRAPALGRQLGLFDDEESAIEAAKQIARDRATGQGRLDLNAVKETPSTYGAGPWQNVKTADDPSTLDEADFIPYDEWYRVTFAERRGPDGEVVGTNLTHPITVPNPPLGAWRIDGDRLNYGREIAQLRLVDPNTLTFSEDPLREGRAAYVEQYREWARQGMSPPPITVLESLDGSQRIIDGHRRATAAREAGVYVPAWVYPAMPSGKTDSEGKPIEVGLTFEATRGGTPAGVAVREAGAEYAPGPVWYSKLEQAIEAKLPTRASADQVRGVIRSAGVKPEEVEWTDLDSYLAEHPKVEKAALLEHVRANQVQVQEVWKGGEGHRWPTLLTRHGDEWEVQYDNGPSAWFDSQAAARDAFRVRGTEPAKFASYQLPGGENYRELLLTMPQRQEPSSVAPGKMATVGVPYRSPHWDEPNVLARVRFNDRTDADGKRVLFIEEIQSDWHQRGRTQGYEGEPLAEAGSTRLRQLEGRNDANWPPLTAAERAELVQLRFRSESFTRGVPDAPFKKTWPELAFKRMLRYAAENGYDRIAWTTGEQQAERYDLSKQVDKIDYARRDDGTYVLGFRKDGREVEAASGVAPEKLADYIGKDAAQKVLDNVGREPGDPAGAGSLRGVDLRVGGEGMKGFYDVMLPSAVNKLVKGWGARVAQTTIKADNAPESVVEETARRYGADHPFVKKNRLPVWSVDITPEMRDTVTQHGLALFEPRRGYTNGRVPEQLFLPGFEPGGDQAPRDGAAGPDAGVRATHPAVLPGAGSGGGANGPAGALHANPALPGRRTARPGVDQGDGAAGARHDAGTGVDRVPEGRPKPLTPQREAYEKQATGRRDAALRRLGVPKDLQTQTAGALVDLEAPVQAALPADASPAARRKAALLSLAGRMEREGGYSYVGLKAGTPEELAQLIQGLRDSRFETFRVFYVNDAGEILASEGVTSAAPGHVDIESNGVGLPEKLRRMARRMERLGATGYYLQHNHPSGKPAPSDDDVNLTKRYARIVPGFRGHIIIDHETAAVLDPGASSRDDARIIAIPAEARREAVTQAVPGARVAEKAVAILDPPSAVEVAVALGARDAAGKLVAIFASGGEKPVTRAVFEFSPDAGGSGGVAAFAGTLRGMARAIGSGRIVLVATAGTETPGRSSAWRTLIRERVVEDVVVFGKAGDSASTRLIMQSYGDFPSGTGLWGHTATKAVHESTTEYGGGGQLPGMKTEWGGEIGPETRIEALVRIMQDKFTRMATAQRAVEGATKQRLLDEEDAYLAEELRSGRAGARLTELEHGQIDPLAKIVRQAHKKGITYEDVNRYLYARHAPERNAAIREIDPENDAGSGMSDAEAHEIMTGLDQRGVLPELHRIGALVDQITRAKVEGWVADGLMTPQQAAAMRAKYPHYVPLKGNAVEQEIESLTGPARPHPGQGRDIRGKETKRALGRTTLATHDVLAQTVMDAEEAIVRGEKNRVGEAFLRLVEDFPNSEVWEVNQVKMGKVLNRETGQVEEVPQAWRRNLDPNVIGVKRNGVQYYITIHDPLLARAMRDLGSANSGTVLRALSRLTRVYSALRTSWNPEFLTSNFLRDTGEASVNLSAEEFRGVGHDVRRNIGRAVAAIYGAERDHPWLKEWQGYWHEFQRDGAKTSYVNLRNIEDQQRRIEDKMRSHRFAAWAATKDGARAIGKLIGDANDAIENGVRLAAYVACRRRGMTRGRAASVAKNLTVNFNRSGEAGPVISALFAFANGGVQGVARMSKALKSKRVWTVLGGLAALTAAQAVINALLGGEDADGTRYWDRISPQLKERNFIVMIPGTNGRFIHVPLPYGYSWVSTAATALVDEVALPLLDRRPSRRSFSASRAAVRTADGLLNSFNPFSGVSLGGIKQAVGSVIPSVLKPFYGVAVNQTSMGAPVKPEQLPFGPPRPESELAFRGASAPSRAAARALNTATGGNTVRPGAISVSPEVMDFLWDEATGGIGRMLRGAVDTLTATARGTAPDVGRVPFVRGVVGQVTDRDIPGRFVEAVNAVEMAQREIKVIAGAQRSKFLAEHGAELRLGGLLRATESRLRTLHQIQRTRPSDAVDERILSLQKQFLARYQEATHAN